MSHQVLPLTHIEGNRCNSLYQHGKAYVYSKTCMGLLATVGTFRGQSVLTFRYQGRKLRVRLNLTTLTT